MKINKKSIFIPLILIILAIIYVIYVNVNKSEEKYVSKKHYEANEINFVEVDYLKVSKIYLNIFKNNLIFDREKAYNLLNNEYREKKFGSYDNFNIYIEDKYNNDFSKLVVNKYYVNNEDDINYYEIIDKNDDVIFIKENGILDFEVYLDDYTVDIG